MSTLIQRSFAGGEIAPALRKRVDLAKYAYGLSTLRNMVVEKSGGIGNKHGLEYLCPVKDQTKKTRNIPFIYSSQLAYVLEFGNLYIRILKDGQPVREAAKTITYATTATPPTLTINAHGYADGDEVFINDIVGTTELNGRFYRVSVLTANTFHLLDLDGALIAGGGFTSYVSGGTSERVYSIVTPYTEADLFKIKYTQNANYMWFACPGQYVRQLNTISESNWNLALFTYASDGAFPAGTYINVLGAAGTATYSYQITTVSATGQESDGSPVSTSTGNATLSKTNKIEINWSAVAGATAYNVYKLGKLANTYEYLATVDSPFSQYIDDGTYNSSVDDNPPENAGPKFGDKPSAVGSYQQRLILGNFSLNSERVLTSVTAQYNNFAKHGNIEATDSLDWAMLGRQINEVNHILDLGALIILTSGGEWVIQGDNGIIGPGEINPKQISYNGSNPDVMPVIINNIAMYVQARGSIIRSLGYQFQSDGYNGDDITTFASHLFKGKTIVDWAFQQVPNSILWVILDDGSLAGMTFIKEQEILAWHRHDTDGDFESICSIPENGQDVIYVVVRRTINGVTKRYQERLKEIPQNEVDMAFMDSYLTYDGRNYGAETMTMTGSDWTHESIVTLTRSVGGFTPSDVGNEIHITGPAGELVRFVISGYTSSTEVTGSPQRTVPVYMMFIPHLNWAKAVDQFAGLSHLEGKAVSVIGDSYVVASPNNASYDVVTVTSGIVTLDKCHSVVHIGLPITSDIKTLNIDTAQGETLSNKKMIVNSVTVSFEESRGLFAGQDEPTGSDPLENMKEYKPRSTEDYDTPNRATNEDVNIAIDASWNSTGSVFLRHVDPLRLKISAIAPNGLFPFRGG